MQIRARLTLQFCFIVAILLLFTLLLIYAISRDQLKREFFKGLESKALMTAEMIVKHYSLKPEDYILPKEGHGEIDLPSKQKMSIYTSKLEKVFSFQKNDDIPLSVLKNISKLKDSESINFKIEEFDAIGIKYKNSLNEEYLLISQGVFSSEELVRLTYILTLVFFIIILLVGISGYVFSVQALSPISGLIHQMDAVYPSQIGKRLETGQNNDEITQLAKMFNQLLEKAEEAFLNQKGFMSNISHELKNPIASVIAQLEVTLHLDRSSPEYKKVMESILKDMKELKTVVDQLMQLARLTSGDDQASFHYVRLDELIWQVQTSIKQLHVDYTVKVDTSLLPENPDDLLVEGNELLLKTALSNLFENACKFSPDHTAYIRIFMNESNHPVIEIEDIGHSIPKEEQSLIFKSFYRSPGTSHIKGTGIGLPLVQQILKMHHAKIGLTSENGNGNKFTIWFNKLTNDNFEQIKSVG